MGVTFSGVGGAELVVFDNEERAKSLARTAKRWSLRCTNLSTESSKSTFSSLS